MEDLFVESWSLGDARKDMVDTDEREAMMDYCCRTMWGLQLLGCCGPGCSSVQQQRHYLPVRYLTAVEDVCYVMRESNERRAACYNQYNNE